MRIALNVDAFRIGGTQLGNDIISDIYYGVAYLFKRTFMLGGELMKLVSAKTIVLLSGSTVWSMMQSALNRSVS